VTQDNKLENLRNDKERFVAFSFAAADLLIELDNNGVVVLPPVPQKG